MCQFCKKTSIQKKLCCCKGEEPLYSITSSSLNCKLQLYITVSGSPASQVRSIKLKYLGLAHRKHPDHAHLWMASGRKKLAHPPGVWLEVGLYPLPFSTKGAWFLTGRVVLWDPSPPSSRSAGFPNKVTVLCPISHLSDYWSVNHWQQYELGLVGNIMIKTKLLALGRGEMGVGCGNYRGSVPRY